MISVAFAGLTYLTLFLAAKFSTNVPFLRSATGREPSPFPFVDERKASAAPPLYLWVIVFIPFGAAIYIASTRFTDYKHAGFDVLSGSLEGAVVAWFAFRVYHLPVRRGAGWAWAPRHRNAAWGIGVGMGSYGILSHSKPNMHRQADAERAGADGRHTASVELRDLRATETASGSYDSHRALV